MTGVCPCCGNDLDIGQDMQFRPENQTLVSSTYAVIFTKNEAETFDLLWRNRNTGRVVTKEMIFTQLYALDPNGGPDPKVVDCHDLQHAQEAHAHRSGDREHLGDGILPPQQDQGSGIDGRVLNLENLQR